MAKVFRLHDIQGDNTLTDWQVSKIYGSQALSEIKDPDGADAKKEITSIPSPFARIDLVKTAFKEVVRMANLPTNHTEYESFDGKTIYHRMVSDAWDVAEIFFNFEKYRDKFEIIIWDKERDLNVKNVFGKTMQRYLESDSRGDDPYNFGKLKRFYLLNYIGPGKPSNLNIVGATSPATLFFSSSNDLDYVSQNVIMGNDRPFDKVYQPLYKRDFEFQKYLYTFRKAYGEKSFHNDFPEIDDYLTSRSGKVCNFNFLNDEQKNEISRLDESSINNYESIKIGANGNDTLDILGKPFHKKSSISNWKSEFEIKSINDQVEKLPLVLPVEAGTTYEKLKFTTDEWGRVNKAPYKDTKDIDERRLPMVHDVYPYLTISDFLTDTIVRMPYKLNEESYFNGNYVTKEDVSYLLPLTEKFFTYFTNEELQGFVSGTKKMFEITELAGGVKVVLRIPIVGNTSIKFIEYTRAYFELNQPDIANNDGALINKKIGLGIMPLVKFPDNVNKHYRVALFDKGERDIKLDFYNDILQIIIDNEQLVVRDKKNIEMNETSKETYVVTDNFDRIKVNLGEVSGVIIPKFKSNGSNKNYTFAVDFGTTNTHIEYGFVTNDNERVNVTNSFDIILGEKQLHRLHQLYFDRDINGAFEHNFIPETLADKDDFQFPIRTAFSEWINNDRNKTGFALANGNIPFLYEKEMFPSAYNDVRTELKWRGEDDFPLIKLYLQNLFLMLRNKVMINGGNLSKTKIIWFYPASMETGRRDLFNNIWAELYKDLFGENADKNLISISESTAPYRYFLNKRGARSEVVTIDVGGGTTDVYVVESSQPKMLLSFLFASNAVFGDAFNWDSDSNGFIKLYLNNFRNTLSANELSELEFTLNQIENRKHSPDIIAFLFSLINNKKVKGNDALNFLQKLSHNKKLKYVFILFYASIIYYIAKAMKSKGLKKPLTIAFTGNGSKTLSVLSTNTKTISEFAVIIFDKVYNDGTSTKLDIIYEEEPKKATCKGGILDPTPQTPSDIRGIKSTLLGDNMDVFSNENNLKYGELDEEILDKIVDSTQDFSNFLFDLHEQNHEFLTSSLSADENILEEVKQIATDRIELMQSLKSALRTKGQNKKIEETLFFYPLIGVIHKLAQRISEM